MSKTENQLKSELVKMITSRGWYARRFEDQYAVGVMDMIIAIPFGPTCAVEAKRVEHKSFGPTPRQWIELDRFAAGGKSDFYPPRRLSLILGFKEGLMYLHEYVKSATLDECMAQTRGEHPCDFFMRFYNSVK